MKKNFFIKILLHTVLINLEVLTKLLLVGEGLARCRTTIYKCILAKLNTCSLFSSDSANTAVCSRYLDYVRKAKSPLFEAELR